MWLNDGGLIFSRSDAYAGRQQYQRRRQRHDPGRRHRDADRQQHPHRRDEGDRTGRARRQSRAGQHAHRRPPTTIWAARRERSSWTWAARWRSPTRSRSPGRSSSTARRRSTIDTQINTVTASGVVSGLAPLVKDGIGTLILTNTNSQVGGAVINPGTLQIGGGAGTGTLNGNVSIAANARLVFDRANATSFGGISRPRRPDDVRRHHQRRGRGRPDGDRHAHRARCPYLYGRDHRRRRAAAGRRIDRGTGAGGRRRPAGRHGQHRRYRDHRQRRRPGAGRERRHADGRIAAARSGLAARLSTSACPTSSAAGPTTSSSSPAGSRSTARSTSPMPAGSAAASTG